MPNLNCFAFQHMRAKNLNKLSPLRFVQVFVKLWTIQGTWAQFNFTTRYIDHCCNFWCVFSFHLNFCCEKEGKTESCVAFFLSSIFDVRVSWRKSNRRKPQRNACGMRVHTQQFNKWPPYSYGVCTENPITTHNIYNIYTKSQQLYIFTRSSFCWIGILILYGFKMAHRSCCSSPFILVFVCTVRIIVLYTNHYRT